MTTRAWTFVLFFVILILFGFLYLIFGDGRGGPVIVIDPEGGLTSVVAASATPVSWTVTCDAKPAASYGSIGFPPSIPSRFVNTKGIEKIVVDPPVGGDVTTIELLVERNGKEHRVKLELLKPGNKPRWTFDDGIVIGNTNRLVEWPDEMLWGVKEVKVNGNVTAIDKIRVYYNKAWGYPGCN